MTVGARRLQGVDLARGLALVGMVAAHVFPGSATGVHRLVDGTSAALFATLAGVGLALLSGGPRPRVGRALRRSVAVRAAVVASLGLLLGLLPTPVAIVLAYYGLLLVVALPLLGLPARALAALAAALAAAGPVASFLLRPHLPVRVTGNPSFAALDRPVRLLETLTVTGYYPVLAWSAYLCAGLAVGRMPLRRVRVQAGLLLGGVALVALAAGLSALLLGPLGGLDAIAAASGEPVAAVRAAVHRNQFGNVPTSTPWWLAVDAPHASTPLDLLRTVGTSLAVLGAALLAVRPAQIARAVRPVAAAGAMTLTLYSLHVAFLASVGRDRPLALWSGQVAVALVLAVLWLDQHRRGPVEALVARLARPGPAP